MGSLPPVFIGGAGRSGTTLLVDLLGRHPRVSPVYETDFVVSIIELLVKTPPPPTAVLTGTIEAIMDEWTRPLPHRPHSKRDYERYLHGPHYVLFEREFALERTREFCGDVAAGRAADGFRRFVVDLFAEHCRLDGKPFWVNKTPAYIYMLPVFKGLWPDFRFIHAVRDGRDVACSVITRAWGPTTFPEAATWWRDTVAQGTRFGQNLPQQYLEVRYEDLVCNPGATLEKVVDWLGLEGAIALPASETEHTLDPARIGKWEAKISAEDLEAFQSIAGDTLERLGYGVPQS